MHTTRGARRARNRLQLGTMLHPLQGNRDGPLWRQRQQLYKYCALRLSPDFRRTANLTNIPSAHHLLSEKSVESSTVAISRSKDPAVLAALRRQ